MLGIPFGELGGVLAAKGLGKIVRKTNSVQGDRPPAGTPDNLLPEANFAGQIPTRADLENHLANAQVSGRQISGGHNMTNFENTLLGEGGRIVAKTEIVPGVYEVQYQLPKGLNKAPATKTVYDPSIYSDAQMSIMASEAAARAQIQYQISGDPRQYVKVNDVWFYVPIGKDGIRTVYPSNPPGK